MKLTDFFQHKFNSDPFSLLDAAADELNALAHAAGINWFECAPQIQLTSSRGSAEKFTKYTGHGPAVISPKLKGKVEIYSRMEVTQDGIKYPFVNFVSKGSDAGVWSGYQYLHSEYRRYQEQHGGTVVPLTAREIERRNKAEAKRKERERQAEIAVLLEKQRRDADLNEYLEFAAAFARAPVEDGTWPYAIKKGISAVFSACNVRRVTYWDRGPNSLQLKKQTVMAIPLSHLDGRHDGRIVGWQRIDQRGGKFQTRAITSGDFVGACFVIGDLKGAQNVAVVEGFATGASVWLATRKDPKKRFDAVVVAVAANNMIHVVEQLVNMYPAAQITCALDNDRKSSDEEKGNTGLRTGYEILQKFSGIKCVYPAFEDDPELECSDFNDLHSLRGLKEVARQLKKNHLSRATDLLSLTLNKLRTIPRQNRRTFAKELLRAVDIGMLTCPVPNSPKELMRLFSATLREMGIAEIYNSTVKDHITRRLNRKCRVAQTPRSFSERITNPNLRPSHITYKRFETSRMTDEVMKYAAQLQGIVIVRASMGSGKSTGLLRPLMLQATRGVSVAHRVSLIGGLHEMMTEGLGAKADILHYQDPGYQEMAPYTNKLTICINSITKGCWQPMMRQHDFFGFDEATQGLRAILAGRAMENPVGVFNTLIDALARTEDHALMVDADANDLLVDLAELAMKRREDLGLPAWLQIHVIELPVDVRNRETNKPIRVFYTEKNRIMTEVIAAVQRGERIMLATDSSTFAEDVTMQLKLQFPDKKFLCVNQKNKQEKEVDDFTNQPKVMVKKYDGLIYSPSISSGVSIEEKHFHRHFGMFCGEVIPSDAIQMLRRDRTAQEYIIGFDKLRGKRETDPEKIKRAYAQALFETAGNSGLLTDVVFDGDRISLGVANSSFMQLKIKAAALEASARNDYASNMICIMHDDGYQVAPMATDALANSIGKDLRKEARELVFEQLMERHLSVDTPDQGEHDELIKKRTLSLDEQAQMVRWDIEKELHLDVDEVALKFYFDGGLKKVRLFETMQLDEITARRLDREEALIHFTYAYRVAGRWQRFVTTAMTREQADEEFQAKFPAITDYRVESTPVVEIGMRGFYTLKSATLRQYFRDCGIDPETLAGEADMDALKHARDNLVTPERRDLLNNVLRIGGFNTEKGKKKAPADLCIGILESMGLSSKTRRARDGDARPTMRSIDPESVEFLMHIVEKRREAGLSIHARKVEKTIIEVDRDLDLHINIHGNPRSKTDLDMAAPQPVISQALEAIPVAVPEAWAENALPATEMEAVRLWPLASIARTFASLYMTEFMDQLSVREIRLLKAFLSKRPALAV